MGLGVNVHDSEDRLVVSLSGYRQAQPYAAETAKHLSATYIYQVLSAVLNECDII